ncbi:helix-turn-helix domain-containing protein [Marinobacter salinexigens]|uniref:Helix-turn-helix domain-containing protein n=1 Tax=Marinobacter salinexigens TaxID=2919747 RepID=A0A5B0VPG7_9GAMM|nr:helix-turn-helix domain-containing protein [Marinobacter salinexigens]KAA1176178.1 helix-turn-helix domain-containing protein [Marinobacter salinexigens]
MIKIAIVALPYCHGSGVIGIMDFFAAANFCDQPTPSDGPRFDCQIVTVDGAPVTTYSGVSIAPTTEWPDYNPDLIIVGSAMEAVLGDRHIDTSLARSAPIHDWLRNSHQQGATLASVCTGSFVLAEAGLLANQVATTHWRAAPAFRRRFPEVRLEADELLIDNGQIICAGGATSFVDLCLYLVEKLGSPSLALACSKLLILDARRTEQTPYMSFYSSLAHQDDAIAETQRWLETHYNDPLSVDQLAGIAGIGTRTFKRRFKDATGETPLHYIQQMRIEAAKHQLESTQQQTSQIIWGVGYEDTSSFRRLFKRTVGCTMEQYRRRFSYVTPRLTSHKQQPLASENHSH